MPWQFGALGLKEGDRIIKYADALIGGVRFAVLSYFYKTDICCCLGLPRRRYDWYPPPYCPSALNSPLGHAVYSNQTVVYDIFKYV